ncbi:MAG: class I SAM-dependent methyltransferase, partial [Candidatus Binatia bacterium]
MFQRIKPVVKAMLRPFADALVVSSQALPGSIDDQITKSQAFMQNPRIAAKFYPCEEDSKSYLTLEPEVRSETGDLPVPPRELWEGYGSKVETYLASGRKDAQKMAEILAQAGFSFRPGNRILDFGCAAGRMIRHLGAISAKCEVWGVDVSAKHISWCRQNLSPPFHFVSSTTFPYLPFEDHYFDFIYA